MKKRTRWRRAIVLTLAIGLIGGVSLLAYQQRNTRLQLVFNDLMKVKAWIVDHTSRVHKQIAQVKQLAAKDDQPPEIHFEFYTALPKMQVEVQQEQDTSAKPVVTAEKKTLAPAGIRESIGSKGVSKATIAASETRTLSSEPGALFSNPTELEKEVSRHIQTTTYSLQLGLFKSPDLAENFQSTLAQKGFTAKVSKVTLGKKDWYRVQYGSFTNKDDAKATQLKLQKKGINGILHKEVV